MLNIPNVPFFCSCGGGSSSIGHATFSSMNSEPTKSILAERYKTSLCRNYMSFGKCQYDIRCMFAHGLHELRTAEMNVNDGLVTEEAIRAFQRYWRNASLSSQRRQQEQLHHHHRPMCGYPPCSYPAPPLRRGPVCYCDCGFPETMVTSPVLSPYTHDPYIQDLLPPASRLYSKLPVSSLAQPAAILLPPQCDEVESLCSETCLEVPVHDGVQKKDLCCDDFNDQTAIDAERCCGHMHPSCSNDFVPSVSWGTQRSNSSEKDDEEAGCSACSSAGSESGKHQESPFVCMNDKQCKYGYGDADKVVFVQ